MQFDKTKIYSTLEKRSEDDNGVPFIESLQEVLDFDEITQEILPYACTSEQEVPQTLYATQDADWFQVRLSVIRCFFSIFLFPQASGS